VRARVDDLRSDTIAIVVTGAPDSIAPRGDTLINLTSDVLVSSAIVAELFDLTTDAENVQPSAEKPVTFVLLQPLPGSQEAQGVFLTAGDTVPGADPHSVRVTTDRDGRATAFLRRIADSQWPDSAVVGAVAVTAVGDTVVGCPARYVIVLEQGR
jgi:hypothetical protein